MLDTPLRNVAFLSGFAWRENGQWLLQQRAPLPMALPLTLADGVREPELSEPIDLIGHMDTTGGLHVVAEHISRAALTSFPPKLSWEVENIRTRGKSGVKSVKHTGAGSRSDRLHKDIAALLQAQSEIPAEVRELCGRDLELSRWLEGATTATRLLNCVMVTGFVESLHARDNPYAKRPEKSQFYDLLLRTAAPPAQPMLFRLTTDVPRYTQIAKRLRDSRRIGITLIGEFRAKVKPRDDDPSEVASIEYHVRLRDAATPIPEDFVQGRPDWAPMFDEPETGDGSGPAESTAAVPA